MKISIPYLPIPEIKLSARLSKVSENQSIIILIHGLAVDNDTEPIPSLEKRLNMFGYNTLSLDLYGHGESGGLFEDITVSVGISSIAPAVNFLHTSGFTKIAVIAESFAAHCTLHVANYSKFDFIVLKSPISDYVEIEKSRRSKEVLENWEKTDLLRFINGFGEEKQLKYNFHTDVFAHDGFASAKNITAPMLILHGVDDDIVPIAQSEKLHTIVIGSEFIRYQNSGHKIQMGGYSIKMYEDILEFVKRNF